MPITRYQKLVNLIYTLDKTKTYHVDELKILIQMKICTTEKLVINAINQLKQFHLMQEVEPFRFRVA